MQMLGERIREARKRASMTQEELASKIGVKRSVISKYETGAIDPTTSQLQQIASALNVPIDFFFSPTPISKGEYRWAEDLEAKLQCIGITVEGTSDASKIWFNLPDGILETSFEELELLDQRTDSYLQFLLLELRQTNAHKFIPHKKSPLME